MRLLYVSVTTLPLSSYSLLIKGFCTILETLKKERGKYAEERIRNASKITSEYSWNFETLVLNSKIKDVMDGRSATRIENDVKTMVENLESLKLFEYVPGRAHTAFPLFSQESTPFDAAEYAEDIVALNAELDMWKSSRLAASQ